LVFIAHYASVNLLKQMHIVVIFSLKFHPLTP